MQQIRNVTEWQAMVALSYERPVVLLKFSSSDCDLNTDTRASLEVAEAAGSLQGLYFLVIQENSSLSAQVAQEMGVRHESPQILIIDAGRCTYHASHQQATAGWVARYLKGGQS